MKKLLSVIVLLMLLSGCVTSTGGETITTAVIRGVTIHVTDSSNTVQEKLGKPDELSGTRWYYKGTQGEPTYILIMDGSVQSILKVESK